MGTGECEPTIADGDRRVEGWLAIDRA